MLDLNPFCVCVYVCNYKKQKHKCGDSPQMPSHSANTELENNGSRTFAFFIAVVTNIMFPQVVSEDYASI